MAEAAYSATETALENQRLGALQMRVAALCALIQMCDGYDVGSIGWAVPSLTHAWNLPPAAFSLAFLWSNLGVMAGALASGPIGDRFGRRPLLLASVAIFGLASLASSRGLRPKRSPIGPEASAPAMTPRLDHRNAQKNADGGRFQAWVRDGTAQPIEPTS